MNVHSNHRPQCGIHYHLARILGTKILTMGEKLGTLQDFVASTHGKIPEVTHLVCCRPFGAPSLYIPWKSVTFFEVKQIILEDNDFSKYIEVPTHEAVLLKDQVLDKKVVDMEDREVEVVYDIRLIPHDGKLYASEVDISRFVLLCRIGLRPLAQLIYRHGKLKKQSIPWAYIQPLPENLGRFRGDLKLKVLKENLGDLPAVDLADILETLNSEQRLAIFSQLETEHASDTLEQIDPNVQRELISSLNKEHVAKLVDEMTPAQAADILSALSHAEAEVLLPLLNQERAAKIKAILETQDQQIVNFVTTAFLTVSPEATIKEVLNKYREKAKDIEVVWYLYATDTEGKLVGLLGLPELVLAAPDAKFKDIMIDKTVTLNPENTLKEAAEMFARYGYRAIPITDHADKLLGVIPYRDVMNLKHRFLQ